MKFINLLKKELSELINKQMVISIVFICLIFMIVGQVMEKSIDEITQNTYKLNIANLDDSEFTGDILKELENLGAELNMIEADENQDYSDIMAENKIDNLVVIPKGFSNEILNNKNISSLEAISVMKSTSTMSSISSDTSQTVSLLKTAIGNQLMKNGGFSESDIALTQIPFNTQQVTVVGDKSANIDINTILQNVSVQNMIIPIIIFLLVMYTSQMIIGAISTEKIDKTLETLLSAPVSRSSVLGAKMLAAAIVALLNALSFMISYYVFVGEAMTSTVSSSNNDALAETISYERAMQQLGLNIGVTDYFLIGIQMFLTIMIALSISVILGAMASDAKSASNLIMPVMMCAMVPYMISMVSDINTLPTIIKIVVYAIPFTHTFTAMSNLMFDNNNIFIFGIIYQTVFFAICMFFAIRLFSSDKIFTSSLNLGQKSKLKKKNK